MTTIRMRKSDLKLMIERLILERDEKDGNYQYPYAKDKAESDKFRAYLIVNHKEEAAKKPYEVTKASGSSSWRGLDDAYDEWGEEYEEERQDRKSGLATKALGRTTEGLAILISGIQKTIGLENFISKCFFGFLKKRTSPISAKDLDTRLRDCLRIIADDAVKHKLVNKSGGWGDDSHYSRVANSKAYIERFGEPSDGNYNMAKNMKGNKSIVDSFISQDPLNNIFNTLTHMTIKVTEDKISIKDQYDFNPAVNILGEDKAKGKVKEDPQFFMNEDNFYEFLKDASKGKLRIKRSKGWVSESFISRASIENLCRFYEGLFNYKGVPVDITIPKKAEEGILNDILSFYDDTTATVASAVTSGIGSVYDYFAGDDDSGVA